MRCSGRCCLAAAGLALGLLTVVPTHGATSLAASAPALPQGSQLLETSCILCHGDAELFEGELLEIVTDYRSDVHASVGLSCHDCHGGNPDPAVAEDMVDAMDEELDVNPYVGFPDAAEVPAFCGSCHSDPGYMRRFAPDPRVDQEREYATSQHGHALEAGDTNVATCISCHGIHGILRVSDPDSPVYPTRVAETCRGCHGDASRMSDYSLPDGRPLPVDQYARWRESVHAAAMYDRDDLSAPTCNDCHGNHGAAPPGLDSVTFVCGQCHGREADIFRQSAKRAGFEEHNEFLLDAGEEGCSACHVEPEPQALLSGFHFFGECASCHGNHGVVRPTLAFLSPLPPTPCAICHEGVPATAVEPPTAGSGSTETDAPEAGSLEEQTGEPQTGGPDAAGSAPTESGTTEPLDDDPGYPAARDALLAEAADRGLEAEERFDWLVDEALRLPTHTLPTAEDGSPELRPEFARLFEKFRIGKTAYAYTDPTTGEPVREPILRCASCHAGEDVLGDDARGLRTASEMLTRMRELIGQTAQAERLLLQARRGGVETRDALLEIDQAVNSQIELEVLLHTFAVEPGGAFAAKHQEGLGHADAALVAARGALEELGFRRRGLVVALLVIIAVLLGLALKIRELSRRESAGADSTMM